MKGMIIAKPKVDATEANVVDTYVNTPYPILKVYARGTGTISFDGSELNTTKDVSIPYDLGYKPLIQAFSERKPGGNMCLVQSIVQRASDDVLVAVSFVEDKFITIRFISVLTDPTGTYRYLYYIFYDEALDD